MRVVVVIDVCTDGTWLAAGDRVFVEAVSVDVACVGAANEAGASVPPRHVFLLTTDGDSAVPTAD